MTPVKYHAIKMPKIRLYCIKVPVVSLNDKRTVEAQTYTPVNLFHSITIETMPASSFEAFGCKQSRVHLDEGQEKQERPISIPARETIIWVRLTESGRLLLDQVSSWGKAT